MADGDWILPDEAPVPAAPPPAPAPERPINADAATAQVPEDPNAPVAIVNPYGEPGTIPAGNLQKALQRGYRLQGEVEYEGHKEAKKYGDSELRAGLEGAARGFLPGFDKALVDAGITTREDLRGREEYNPVSSTIGTLGGALLGGEALGIGKLGGLAAKGIEGLGAAEAGLRGGALGLAARVAPGMARGFVEGGVYGAEQGVNNLALSDDPLTAERVFREIGTNAILGAATGEAFGTAGALLGEAGIAARSKVNALVDRMASGADKAVEDFPELAAMDAKGLQKARAQELVAIKENTRAADLELNKARDAEVASIKQGVQLDAERVFADYKKYAETENRGAFQNYQEDNPSLAGRLARSRKKIQFAPDNPEGFIGNPNRALKGLQEQASAYQDVLADLRIKKARLVGEMDLPEPEGGWRVPPSDVTAEPAAVGDKTGNMRVERGPALDTTEPMQIPTAARDTEPMQAPGSSIERLRERMDQADLLLSKNAELQARIKDFVARRAAPQSDKLYEIESKLAEIGRSKGDSPRLHAIDYHAEKVKGSVVAGLVKKSIGGVVGGALGHASGIPGGGLVGGLVGGLAGNMAVERLGLKLANGVQRTAAVVDGGIAAFVRGTRAATRGAGATAAVISARSSLSHAAPAKGRPAANAPVGHVAKRIEEIKHSTTDIKTTRERIHERLHGLHAVSPGLADKVEEISVNALEFLASKLPKDPTPPGVIKIGPPPKMSEADQAVFNRSLAAVVEGAPFVVDQMRSGKLTPEHVDALEAVHPESYKQISATMLDELASGVRDVPYWKQLQMSIFLRQPVSAAMTQVAQLQAHFQNEDGTEGGQRAPDPKALGKKSTPQATEIQRITDR